MKFLKLFLIVSVFFAFAFAFLFDKVSGNLDKSLELPKIETAEQIVNLFPNSTQAINNLAQNAIQDATLALDKIYSIKNQDRTFENTMLALDRIFNNFNIKYAIIYILTMVSPDQEIRNAAQENVVKLQDFSVDNFSQNKSLYQAVKSYGENKEKLGQKLSKSQNYFYEKTLDGYKRAGLEKNNQTREKIKSIQKELGLLGLKFQDNINSDNRFIKVSKEELSGLDQEFINNLKKSEDNLYILGVDYPTYFKILEECKVESTRKNLWQEFDLRGYPNNKQLLEKIINLRDELAHLLDYKSYAHLDIDEQMAENPERVDKFLQDIADKCKLKVDKELECLKNNLPKSIKLVNGKFKPWDLSFTKDQYKKKHLMLDENKISEYFPVDYTLPALLDLYQKFFGVKFEKFDINNLWHDTIQALKVYKDEKFIGTLLLDLFPRENKYSHACQVGIISSVKDSVKDKENIISPAVVLVIANFTKPQENKPALLRRKEVTTFFHECGHAIHSLLGSTKLASQSGTSVKTDFVEMPSQMLEEWMSDKEVLKLITKHYKTGESLPDNIIQKIQENKNWLAASATLGQISYATVSLDLFKDGNKKDIETIWKNSHDKYLSNIIICDNHNYGYCAFGHLVGYGASYYGYLWSSVFAKDLFSKIKEHGLFNRNIGDFYISKVIGKGGSRDPNILLKNFLEREPSPEAFFKDLGLN